MALPAETERDSSSIVLVGRFNPAIFQPMWFAANELLSTEDAENAIINVVHPEITQFATRQFRLSVESEKFIVVCETLYRNVLYDLVVACFRKFLVYTPIRLMGLNRDLHFSVGSEEQRSRYGFELAPLSAWGEWGKEIEETAKNANGGRHGGMMKVAMQQSPRPDELDGYIQTEIQPSTLIRGNAGIYVIINDHYVIDPDEERPASAAMDVLEASWEQSGAVAEKIINSIMLKALPKGR